MSPDSLPAPQTWDPLTEEERRVLGVLVEKQKTSKTADSYPLTLNALTTGCNQKSNRDPVLDLSDDEVEETLSALQRKGLVMRQTGGRVDRFKHLLYEKWTGDGPQLAVLAELLLRGPQTKGELRGRASRMAPIDTLDDLEGVLKPLAARRLVVHLTDPDRRGAVLTHGFHAADELSRARASAGARADADDRAPTTPTGGGERGGSAPRDGELEARVAAVEAEVAELRAAVADLRRQLGG